MSYLSELITVYIKKMGEEREDIFLCCELKSKMLEGMFAIAESFVYTGETIDLFYSQ